jgi:hypothetical protein
MVIQTGDDRRRSHEAGRTAVYPFLAGSCRTAKPRTQFNGPTPPGVSYTRLISAIHRPHDIVESQSPDRLCLPFAPGWPGEFGPPGKGAPYGRQSPDSAGACVDTPG